MVKTRYIRPLFSLYLAGWAAACSDGEPTAPGANTSDSIADGTQEPVHFVALANLEKSAFLSAFTIPGPPHTNANGHEMGLDSFIYVHESTILVTQNNHSDEVLKFTWDASRGLVPAGKLHLGVGARPYDVFFDNNQAYVSLTGIGKLAKIDLVNLQVVGEIDLRGLATGDNNPDPGCMMARDGLLYVALQQERAMFLGHPEVSLAIVDLETGNILKKITDVRGLGHAGAPGESDCMMLDDLGDLYVYANASWGFEPGLAHGFLRIRRGSTEFDPNYLWNLSQVELAVPGGFTNHLTHIAHRGNAHGFATAGIPTLVSQPPDWVNDRQYQVVRFDAVSQQIEVADLPRSNGMAGEVLFEGQHVWASLGAENGTGLFRFDPQTNAADHLPTIPTQGFVIALRPVH